VVDDYDEALLLAVEGRHLDDSAETRSNLLATIERSPDAIAVIRSDTEEFADLAFTPDGKSLLSSGLGAPGRTSKYDVTTHKREASIEGPSRGSSSAISPDGRLGVMSSAVYDRSALRLVDMATFTFTDAPLLAFEDALTRLSFSPDGRYIAGLPDNDLTGSGLAPAVAFVWDLALGGEPVVQYAFAAETGRRDVAFLPDSKRIVVAGADGTAIVDIASGQKVGQIDGAHAPIAISRDGRTLAAVLDESKGVTIGLIDLASGQRSEPLAGHGERVLRLAFSPDGTTLASGADDRSVMVWDVRSGQRRALYTGHAAGVNALAFNPDGKTLWSGGDDRAIFVWDLQHADTLAHRPATELVQGSSLRSAAADMVIGPDGRHVAFPSANDYLFQIRDVATGALGPPSTVEDGFFISFSPDGKRYVTIDDAGRLRVWDRETGAVLADSAGSGRVYSNFPPGEKAAFTPDGRNVVALQVGNIEVESLVVLDAMTLTAVGEPVPVGTTVRRVAVTPDGRDAVVVVSPADHPETKVLVVDLLTRRIERSTPVEAFDELEIRPRNTGVASDGRTLGLGGLTGDIVVVNAVTGDVSPALAAHDGVVESITFAPDEASFISTGQDGTVKLWDTQTQHLLGSVLPLGPNHRVRASFTDAEHVLIVYNTGEIFEWDPRPDTWEAHACRVAGRNLTKGEWDVLFPDKAYDVTCPDFPAGE
jgi:WD40 repeat protein